MSVIGFGDDTSIANQAQGELSASLPGNSSASEAGAILGRSAAAEQSGASTAARPAEAPKSNIMGASSSHVAEKEGRKGVDFNANHSPVDATASPTPEEENSHKRPSTVSDLELIEQLVDHSVAYMLAAMDKSFFIPQTPVELMAWVHIKFLTALHPEMREHLPGPLNTAPKTPEKKASVKKAPSAKKTSRKGSARRKAA